MDVMIFLVAGVAFTAAFIALMIGAAKRGRLVVAAILGAMALSNPIAYPLSLIQAGVVSVAEGMLIILAMIAPVMWLAYRAFRKGQVSRCASIVAPQ